MFWDTGTVERPVVVLSDTAEVLEVYTGPKETREGGSITPALGVGARRAVLNENPATKQSRANLTCKRSSSAI